MQVNCVLQKGDRPVNFTWVFNDIVLQSGNGIRLDDFGKSSILTLDPVRGIHKGIYTCIASNQAGEEQVSARLVVNGIVVDSLCCYSPVMCPVCNCDLSSVTHVFLMKAHGWLYEMGFLRCQYENLDIFVKVHKILVIVWWWIMNQMGYYHGLFSLLVPCC